jgi:hypothetical protein
MAMSTSNVYRRRIHQATFERHNGNQDATGAPTYNLPTDWRIVMSGWPCEVLTTTGGERMRGRQVSASTTHILVGDFFSAADKIDPECRAWINGRLYNIVAVIEPDGLNRELRIEVKQSW